MSVDVQTVHRRLEPWFFNASTIDELVRLIQALEPQWQVFALDWIVSISRTEPELGYQFALGAGQALRSIGSAGCERWLQAALDQYFETGLEAAVQALRDLDRFIATQHRRNRAIWLRDVHRLLQNFLKGLGGRHLQIKSAETAGTDSERLYLPEQVDLYPDRDQNFACYRALAAHHWSQCRYGTWRADSIDQVPREEPMLRTFHFLETLRLNACIARDFPGLARRMQALHPAIPKAWKALEIRLSDPASNVRDSIELCASHWDWPRPEPFVYQGSLDPDRVQATLEARLGRERERFEEILSRHARPSRRQESDLESKSTKQDSDSGPGFQAGNNALPVDDEIDDLVISIQQDLGELPEEYLRSGIDRDYRAGLEAREYIGDEAAARRSETGAAREYVYDEWDCTRRAHRKGWCTVREHEIEPDPDSDFGTRTLEKYRGHIKSLRRGFEALRDEYRMLRKQPYGDSLDFDALVDAMADMRSGREMTSRIYRKAHRVERDIAVILMVDMSGSTQGWINLAQREALILLAEALNALDDRYAIYGFSGNTRKRCEIYRIKTFEETYGDTVQARIAAIQPQDYTRMGATIRHLSDLLEQVAARTRLLITLSDGKPDDYDAYHGEYGIEDTRMALLEAHRRGIHSFCITIDEQAREYLPHMYGDHGYLLINDVTMLPYRITEIYRGLTS